MLRLAYVPPSCSSPSGSLQGASRPFTCARLGQPVTSFQPASSRLPLLPRFRASFQPGRLAAPQLPPCATSSPDSSGTAGSPGGCWEWLPSVQIARIKAAAITEAANIAAAATPPSSPDSSGSPGSCWEWLPSVKIARIKAASIIEVANIAAAATKEVAGIAGAATGRQQEVAGAATGRQQEVAGAATGRQQEVAGAATGRQQEVAGAATGRQQEVAGAATGRQQEVVGAAATARKEAAIKVAGKPAEVAEATKEAAFVGAMGMICAAVVLGASMYLGMCQMAGKADPLASVPAILATSVKQSSLPSLVRTIYFVGWTYGVLALVKVAETVLSFFRR